ncbi:hypothetical protein SAMN05444266_103447 [Chitinophaga jiangningensis]|uniref:Uncharacterized protein n=1 Tax=Chitinophaga jiangningensis TaxID=1419482 RepID=A0A1M7AXU0_9BACT|nr:hypothetical protein [Chitinophaga jiangningensis]SHL47467.1 hypothetical protein SAMN05444266_103447 [Chitinophaga jiangningensis]
MKYIGFIFGEMWMTPSESPEWGGGPATAGFTEQEVSRKLV